MLRRTNSRLVDLAPTSLSAALMQRRVQRLLGGPFASAGESSARLAHVFTAIIESGKKTASVEHGKELAYAGRAVALLNCGSVEAAAEDIAAAAKNSALARICASLRVRCSSAKLQHYLRTSGVQGSEAYVNPKIIDELQCKLAGDLNNLANVAEADDFVPVLLIAESTLSNGSSADKIADAFAAIKEEMFRAPAVANMAALTGEKVPRYAAVAFDAQRAWAAEKALLAGNSGNVKTPFKHVKAGTGFVVDKALNLTTEENAAMMQAAAWLEDKEAAINVLDMGDAGVAGYRPSAHSQPLLVQVGHFLGLQAAHNAVCPNLDRLIANIKAPGSHDVASIEAALKDSTKPFLENSSFSDGASRLGLADDAFATLLESLDEGYSTGTDFANLSTPRAQDELVALESSLLAQAEARAQVGFAAGLAQAGKLDKASAVLDDVITENNYVEIWRAYLLKGNVAKKLGQIEQSDAAFRMLHSLKMQPEGRDLPLRDKFRDISAF